jgi:hypothetical protein
MPCLQVLRFFGLEYSASLDDDDLPSLREIRLYGGNDKIKAALRSAAEAHPNPTVLRFVWRDGGNTFSQEVMI